MTQDISASEVTELIAYFSLFPFGDERADLRVGYSVSLQTNAARTSKKHRVWKPQDFYPEYLKLAQQAEKGSEVKAEGMTDDEMLEEASRFVSSFNKANADTKVLSRK